MDRRKMMQAVGSDSLESDPHYVLNVDFADINNYINNKSWSVVPVGQKTEVVDYKERCCIPFIIRLNPQKSYKISCTFGTPYYYREVDKDGIVKGISVAKPTSTNGNEYIAVFFASNFDYISAQVAMGQFKITEV